MPLSMVLRQVPSGCLQSGAGQLQSILSSPQAIAAMALPPDVATELLQNLINSSLLGAHAGHNVPQVDGASAMACAVPRRKRQKKKKKVRRVEFSR